MASNNPISQDYPPSPPPYEYDHSQQYGEPYSTSQQSLPPPPPYDYGHFQHSGSLYSIPKDSNPPPPAYYYVCFQQYGIPHSLGKQSRRSPQTFEHNNNVVQPSAQNTSQKAVTESRPSNYMIPAVLACLCCCWPIGIFAIKAALDANSAAKKGDFQTANQKARIARIRIMAAVIFGIIIFIIIILIIVAFSSEYSVIANQSTY